MRLLVFGASGGTGRQLVEQALEQGHTVTAFARNPSKIHQVHDNLRVAKGDILDASSVDAAVTGQDGVLSALGTRIPVKVILAVVIVTQIVIHAVQLAQPARLLIELGIPLLVILLLSRRTTTISDGARNIVSAMEREGVKRLIFESSLGVGDSKWRMGLLHNLVAIPLFLRNIFADKEVQEKIVRSSALDWVIVRPSVLTDGPKRSAYRVGADVGNWLVPSRISRADVAAFMLEQVIGAKYLRQTPGLAN